MTDTKRRKKVQGAIICAALIIACLTPFVVHSIKVSNAKTEVETLCERIETEIPELIIANIEDPERFTRIDVEASSEIEHNKYHPWYEWTTVINVKFRVRDSFDDKSDLDKYYFIDKYGEQAETAIMESGFYALISGYRDSLSDKSKLLKEAYGERVRIDYEYNFYFITSANKYEFAENMKYYFLKNGIDVWVRDAYGNWYGDLPVKPAESEEKTTWHYRDIPEDEFPAADYADPEDFYDDYYDDFWDYEDAEDYWYEHS